MCPKISKFCQKFLIGRVPYLQILFKDNDFYTFYATELGPLSLKTSSYFTIFVKVKVTQELPKKYPKWSQIDYYCLY